jgi:hypothetical protein
VLLYASLALLAACIALTIASVILVKVWLESRYDARFWHDEWKALRASVVDRPEQLVRDRDMELAARD